MADKNKLELWKKRLADSETAYENELSKMDDRERIYAGDRSLRSIVAEQKAEAATHVRNIAAELIESQVSSGIPMPKVTPKRRADEWRAKLIEDMLRGELDRMPFEDLNDMQERTVPIQGGGIWLVEWDNTLTTHTTTGDLWITVVHPKQIIPQNGVTAGVEDMDYIIVKLPQTKEYIKRRYGVDVSEEAEEEPDARALEGEGAPSEEMVTQYMAYYRNESGGIGLYAWVRDSELCDYEDYQARRLRRCTVCGGVAADTDKRCADCGGALTAETSEAEDLTQPVLRSDGVEIPGGATISYYKPDVYPVVLQKNVSMFGRLLGDSDIDKISDQQNTINVISSNIIDKLLAGGSYLTLPANALIKRDSDRKKVIIVDQHDEMNMIKDIDLTENIQPDLAYLSQVYEEARQIIGVTDSFLGRRDTTATSGKAKEFSAAQTAGRLESKRVMKNAAYAKLYEIMFKFKLAYADESRPVTSDNYRGDREYGEFSRYDFLEQDAAGEWYYVDDFIFSTDTSAPLASNREAMWQETRLNLQSGAFGDPMKFETLILFWAKMEQLHYPGAGETKKYIEDQLRHIQEQAQMQTSQPGPAGVPLQTGDVESAPPVNESVMIAQVDAAAKRDALKSLMGGA